MTTKLINILNIIKELFLSIFSSKIIYNTMLSKHFQKLVSSSQLTLWNWMSIPHNKIFFKALMVCYTILSITKAILFLIIRITLRTWPCHKWWGKQNIIYQIKHILPNIFQEYHWSCVCWWIPVFKLNNLSLYWYIEFDIEYNLL